MSLPGFAAEASLDKLEERYVVRSELSAEAGSVLPQGLFVNRNGDLVYCDNVVGCFVVHHKQVYKLF